MIFQVFPSSSPALPARSTICICCGESSTPRRRRNHAYKNRRTLRLSRPDQMDRLLTERALIESEVDCSQMEPVEVMLVFDTRSVGGGGGGSVAALERPRRMQPRHPPFSIKRTTPSSVTLTPRRKPLAVTDTYFLEDDYSDYLPDLQSVSKSAYYDPTKLTFIFSTPSPLRRRYIELRDQQALGDSGEKEEEDKGRKAEKSTPQQWDNHLLYEPAGSEANLKVLSRPRRPSSSPTASPARRSHTKFGGSPSFSPLPIETAFRSSPLFLRPPAQGGGRQEPLLPPHHSTPSPPVIQRPRTLKEVLPLR